MMLYYKMQILDPDNHSLLNDTGVSEYVKKRTTALRQFCRLLGISITRSKRFDDTFYAVLPEDKYDACILINALEAFCYVSGDIAHRLASENVTVPLDDFLTLLSSLDNDD